MDTTHEHTPTEATLRARFLHIRQPWRDVWTGMLAAPVGAVSTLILGTIDNVVDPCEGLECIWPLAVVVAAFYLLGAWLVVAGLVALLERLGVPARPLEVTVKVLALASWGGVAVISGAIVVELVTVL